MDTTECDGKLDLVPDISPDGDVVLVVGPQNVRLRVHSQCLRCASKVFAAMFGPPWSEGQGLSKEFPREVQLVEDDADALRTICCVIHHRNDDAPEALTPREVLQIAIEAEKYDLSVALKYARAQWLKPRGDENMVEMGYLMTAAFLFGDMDMFAASTLALILNYEGRYMQLPNDKMIGQTLPWETFCMEQSRRFSDEVQDIGHKLTSLDLLEERRTQMRVELGQLLMDAMHTCKCGFGKSRCDRYKALHSKYGPPKMLKIRVSEIVEDIERAACQMSEATTHSVSSQHYHHGGSTHDKKLLEELKTMKMKASICLDSIGRGDATATCRFQHE